MHALHEVLLMRIWLRCREGLLKKMRSLDILLGVSDEPSERRPCALVLHAGRGGGPIWQNEH